MFSLYSDMYTQISPFILCLCAVIVDMAIVGTIQNTNVRITFSNNT